MSSTYSHYRENCRLSLFVFNTSGEKPLVAVVLLAACHVTTMLSELT